MNDSEAFIYGEEREHEWLPLTVLREKAREWAASHPEVKQTPAIPEDACVYRLRKPRIYPFGIEAYILSPRRANRLRTAYLDAARYKRDQERRAYFLRENGETYTSIGAQMALSPARARQLVLGYRYRHGRERVFPRRPLLSWDSRAEFLRPKPIEEIEWFVPL